MKKITMTVLLSVVVLVLASPATAQTYLQQIFAGQPVFFELDVDQSSQVAFTVMWNRADTHFAAYMVCELRGEALEWAVSMPHQERTLRLDVGVLQGYDCTLEIKSPKTAAFVLNCQVLDNDGDLTKAGGRATLRPVVAGEVPAASLAALEGLAGKTAAKR